MQITIELKNYAYRVSIFEYCIKVGDTVPSMNCKKEKQITVGTMSMRAEVLP